MFYTLVAHRLVKVVFKNFNEQNWYLKNIWNKDKKQNKQMIFWFVIVAPSAICIQITFCLLQKRPL